MASPSTPGTASEPAPSPPIYERITQAALRNSNYSSAGTLADLVETIALGRAALASPDAPPKILSDFAVLLESTSVRTRDAALLDEAILYTQRSLSLLGADAPLRPVVQCHLGNHLSLRFTATGATVDLEESIVVTREALSAAKIIAGSDTHPSLAFFQHNLATKLGRRIDLSAELGDIEEADSLLTDALRLTPQGAPVAALRFSMLSSVLSRHFAHTHDASDLARAVRASRMAVAIGNPNASVAATFATELLDRLFALAEHDGAPQAFDAIANQIAAVRPFLREGAHDAATAQLAFVRFERRGMIADLEQCIALSRAALEQTPDDPSRRAARSGALAAALARRYEYSSAAADMREAAELASTAARIKGVEPGTLASVLANLGSALHGRAQRSRDPQDARRALECARAAVARTPVQHAMYARRMNALADVLLAQRGSRRREGVREAIEVLRVALDSKPSALQRPHLLNSLSHAQEAAYYRSKDPAELDAAITSREEAVAAAPADGLIAAGSFLSLGRLYERRYALRPSDEDLEAARKAFETSWAARSGVPLFRVDAAGRLLQILKFRGDFERASEVALQAAALLPTLSSRALQMADREQVSRKFEGLAEDACAMCFVRGEMSGDVKILEALRVLEVGRAVMLGSALDDRLDLAVLAKEYPEEAASFEKVREALGAGADGSSATQGADKFALLKEYDACVEKIRGLEGFKEFLTISVQQIQEATRDTTVVYVVVTDLRADAIIVSAKDLRHLRLVNFYYARLEKFMKRKGERLVPAEDPEVDQVKNRKFLKFLRWVWRACVRDVLTAMELHEPPEVKPRVHWIGTGVASFVPFHAAGEYGHVLDEDDGRRTEIDGHDEENHEAVDEKIEEHEDGNDAQSINAAKDHGSASKRDPLRENTMSYVVSSYIPSIRTLVHSQSRTFSSQTPHRGHKIFTATMPTTPGMPGRLAAVEQEVAAIRALRGVQVTHREYPSADETIALMKSHDIFHFAGHGISDRADAAGGSCLLLQRDVETPDTVEDKVRQFQGTETTVSSATRGDLERVAQHTVTDHVLAEGDLESLNLDDSSERPLDDLLDEIVRSLSEDSHSPDHKKWRAMTPEAKDGTQAQSLQVSLRNAPPIEEASTETLPSTEQTTHLALEPTKESTAGPDRETPVPTPHIAPMRKIAVRDPLTIEALFKINIQPATLAILSACSTADVQVQGLADEGLHLAAGFLVAGYASVTATLWPADDTVCARVTGDLMAGLFRQDPTEEAGKVDGGPREGEETKEEDHDTRGVPTAGTHVHGKVEDGKRPGDVARALHNAVLVIREEMEDKPLLWAAYVHMGA